MLILSQSQLRIVLIPLSKTANLKRKDFYFPELDSLRTLAVLLTLAAHFLPAVGFPIIPYSWYGVDVFFTISGFLITYILILTKESGTKPLLIIKNFAIRRALRLFPIYYLFLLFFFIAWKFFSLQLWKPDFTVYFFTYTPNFLFYQKGGGYAPVFSHLWSLGIEEQFYLCWPWIVVFVKRNWLLPVILVFISISYFFNTIGYLNPNIKSLPFSNFHTLGSGALLAFAFHYYRETGWMNYLKAWRMLLFAVVFALFVLLLYFYKESVAAWHFGREFGLSIVTMAFVLVSIYGWQGFVQFITKNKFVQYLGRISYGIYLFHLPVPFLVGLAFQKAGLSITNPLLLLFIYTTVTIFAAALSYRFIETWFLNLKKRFA